jgi:SAM-dependent methyltransferase
MFDFIQNVIRGKTIYRILFQKALYRNRKYISGRVLDLGAGINPSYYGYLDKEGREFIRTDYKNGADAVVDFEEPFPFENGSFDTVCIFHALYIAHDPHAVLKECNRVLKENGIFVLSMPFVANEMPEPHDFHRYTLEGLDVLMSETGFKTVLKERIGERGTAAAYILSPLYLIWPIKLIAYGAALFIDWVLPKKLKSNYPFPIGYFYVARK